MALTKTGLAIGSEGPDHLCVRVVCHISHSFASSKKSVFFEDVQFTSILSFRPQSPFRVLIGASNDRDPKLGASLTHSFGALAKLPILRES